MGAGAGGGAAARACKTERPVPEYFRTRAECEARVRGLVGGCAGRVLVGIDVAIGYPRGGRASGLPSGRALCALVASLVRDDARNANTRREAAADLNARVMKMTGAAHGPFWGWMGKGLYDRVPSRRPGGFAFAEYREVDLVARTLRPGTRPQSPWKLGGAGSVGSQSLLAMGMVHRLLTLEPIAARARLWPFEVGTVDGLAAEAVVIAEVWPSLFEGAARAGAAGVYESIRDARQVCAARDAVLDEPGWTRGAIAGAPERGASREEGWILGVEMPRV